MLIGKAGESLFLVGGVVWGLGDGGWRRRVKKEGGEGGWRLRVEIEEGMEWWRKRREGRGGEEGEKERQAEDTKRNMGEDEMR